MFARGLVVDPSNTSRLYLAGYQGFAAPGVGGLFRSTDAGATWTRTAFDGPDVLEIALDSSDANRVYAATATGLQVSTDGGTTFAPNAAFALISSMPVWSVVVDPTVPTTLWASTVAPDLGAPAPRVSSVIARSGDRGASWEVLRAETDQPKWYAERLILDPNVPSLVYTLTGVRGVGAFEIVNDLTLSMTQSANGGASLDLRAENHGTFAGTAARIVAKLPAGLTGVAATPDAGTTCAIAASVLTCNTGVIRPAASTSVHVTYTPVGSAALAVSASLDAHERDGDMSNNAVQAGEVVDLSLTLVPSAMTVTSGGTLTYTASVKNNALRDASGASVTFTAGTGLTLGTTLPSGCTASGSQVTCTLTTLAAGASRDLSFPATATGTGSLTATAVVTALASAVDVATANDNANAAITSNAPPPPSTGGGGNTGGTSGGGGGGSLDVTVLLVGFLAAMASARRRLAILRGQCAY
jgi:hypothetical protein